jgi:RNA polymerase sigma-70 factor (ECF subfamily)
MLQSISTPAGKALDEPEDSLISAAKNGDVEAFGELFERYKDFVYSFVWKSVRSREDAEDIVQETFCRAWKSMSRFRGDSKIITWLCKIAANLAADKTRSPEKKTRSASDLGVDVERLAESTNATGDLESESILRHSVNEALGQLKISQRMLVILCDIQGFNCAEAAGIVGCSHVSARVRLTRARKKLRKLLSPVVREVE